jgi:hypothetical protein
MQKNCENPICGKLFEAKRSSAKYCSDACKVKTNRTGPTMSTGTTVIDHSDKVPTLVIKYPPDLAEYCMNNDITPAELIAFHKKYHNKAVLFDKEIKAPTPGTSYLEQRRAGKLK